MFQINVTQILLAALMFVRVSGVMFALPIFGDEPVPVRVRILASLAITVGMYPLVIGSWDIKLFPLTGNIWFFAMLVIREALVGLCIGFMAKLVIDGILMASSLVGFQMGFGTANLFIPTADDRQTGFTAFNHALILLIFFSLNFHHLYFRAIYDTFRVIPLGKAWTGAAYSRLLIESSASIFVSALQLASPIVVALMFSTAALGLIARTVPQVNVFIVSFPIGFYIGLLVYIATLPMMPGWLNGHFSKLPGLFQQSIAALAR